MKNPRSMRFAAVLLALGAIAPLSAAAERSEEAIIITV